MKKTSTLLLALIASLSLQSGSLWAQSKEEKSKRPEIERAPDVKNFKSLQKLNQQIVSLSKRAQPATVCLIAKNGRGAGSGVVVSEDGLILTAAHVTAGMQGGITVIFPDGTRKTGKPLGADYDRDASMVQITEPGKYPFVEVGESKNLKRNQWTIALGHSGGFDPMRRPPVRLGRVLANRQFVVTDTAVVGGDSGGPLFNVQGKVIGIHSNIGQSLMENRHVPVEVFHRQWDDLKAGKKSGKRFNSVQRSAPSPDRPVLGVHLENSDEGVRVIKVVPNSPAERAGIQAEDLIKKINGKEVKSIEELTGTIKKMKAGDEVKIAYHTDGSFRLAKVKLTSAKKLSESQQPEPKKADSKIEKDASPTKEEPKKKKKGKKKKKAADNKPKEEEPRKTSGETSELDKLIDQVMKAEGNVRELQVTPEQLERIGGMDKLTEEIKKRMEKEFNLEPADESTKKEEAKKEDPGKEKGDGAKKIEDVIDELLKNASEKGGQLEMTPELLEKIGGMEKFMEELEKRGLGQRIPREPDTFFESSLKALAPVAQKNEGSTALITIGDQAVALGTVISADGKILTKDIETQKGKITVHLDEKKYHGKVLKRFPEHDLVLVKIDAGDLHPVRFQTTEPPLGSILTATGATNEPLGIGLLSVPGRAMAKVGFIGIRAGESDKGVLIEQLVPEGAAAEAGLADKDIITKIDGKRVDDSLAFGHLIRGRKAGDKVEVEYLRGDKKGKVTVTLKERALRDNARNDPRMKMSHGNLSEKSSGYPDAIQHDIPLPPQLCGGPLLDLKGKCIGINVSRAGRTKTYAIPADEIQAMLKSAKIPKNKKPAAKKKGDNAEAIKAIRQSLKEIERRLNELERAEQ